MNKHSMGIKFRKGLKAKIEKMNENKEIDPLKASAEKKPKKKRTGTKKSKSKDKKVKKDADNQV